MDLKLLLVFSFLFFLTQCTADRDCDNCHFDGLSYYKLRSGDYVCYNKWHPDATFEVYDCSSVKKHEDEKKFTLLETATTKPQLNDPNPRIPSGQIMWSINGTNVGQVFMNEEHKVHTEESLNASISEFDFKPKRVTLEPKLTDRIQQPLPYKKELKEAELMLIMENDKATSKNSERSPEKGLMTNPIRNIDYPQAAEPNQTTLLNGKANEVEFALQKKGTKLYKRFLVNYCNRIKLLRQYKKLYGNSTSPFNINGIGLNSTNELGCDKVLMERKTERRIQIYSKSLEKEKNDVNCTRFTECDDCVKNGCNYVWNTAACVSEDGIPLDSTFTPAYAPEFCPNPSTPTAIPENEGSFYVIGFWFLFSVIIVLLIAAVGILTAKYYKGRRLRRRAPENIELLSRVL